MTDLLAAADEVVDRAYPGEIQPGNRAVTVNLAIAVTILAVWAVMAGAAIGVVELASGW